MGASERLGIVLPEVYDGISVWQEPDGTYTNRWDPEMYPRRHQAAEQWIKEAKSSGSE